MAYMRSEQPTPGNPWPREMTFEVDVRPHALLELLWLREAYDLEVAGDAPPPLVDTPAPAARPISAQERARWESAWMPLWTAVTEHAGRPKDGDLFDQLALTGDGSPERADILERLTGPSGRNIMGAEAFDDPSLLAWDRRGFDAHVASRPQALAEAPERRDLDSLVPAWRRGLLKVVTIPCRGTYTRTLGSSALLVTDGTRADSPAYRSALDRFAAS